MNVSLARSALAVAAFTLLASAGAGATTRAIRPPAAAEHVKPGAAPHLGYRLVSQPLVRPDKTRPCDYDVCSELYAETSTYYLEYEWCIGYGSHPCSDLYTGSVVWYNQTTKAKSGNVYKKILDYLVTDSESGSGETGSNGVYGNPLYQYVYDEGAKPTNGKYKYAIYGAAYWGTSSYFFYNIGIGVEDD